MADIVSSLFGLSPMQEQAELSSRQRDYDLGTLIGQAGTTGFMTPEQAQNYVNRNAAQAALAGTALRGLGSLFGLQDPQLQRASSLEGILQTTQQELGDKANDPSVFYPQLQRKLSEGGFTREALQVGQVGQKAIQDLQLNQATIAEKTASATAKNREKLGAFAQNLLAAGLQPGTPEWNKAMQDKILKDTYIAEKDVSPQTEAEADILAKYKKLYPTDPSLASEAFLEFKSTLRQKEQAAGVTPTQTEPIDISRLDASFDKFVTPNRDKLGSINEALKLAEQAVNNPQAGIQLNALLSSLYQGGRLSNQDINRTSNAGSLPAQVINNFSKIISGVDTETNIADKVKLLRALQEGTAKALNDSVDSWAERWQTAPGVSKQTIDTYTKGAKFRKKEANKPKTADEYLKGL
jgi:hypothetical protein